MHNVNKGSTSTTVSTSVTPALFGQTVTFTATVSAVAPAVGTPTGTVDFKDGATTICAAVPLAAGSASCPTSSLAPGTHSITAVYSGDSNFYGSTSTALSQVVNKASTTTALSSGTNPSTYGTAVTFSATVTPIAPAAGTPTGTITFKDGATTLGTCTLAAATCSFTTTATQLGGGSHSITAVYGGDANYNTSTSSALTQTVNPAAQTISFTGPADTTYSTTSVTVSATASSGLAVTFTSSTTTVCMVSGTTVSILAIGTCTINANQAGNANYSAAPQVTHSFNITKANLSVAANNQSVKQTQAMPAFSGTITGARASDGITATYTLCCGITSNSAVGVYVDAIVTTINDPNSKLGNYNPPTINNGATYSYSASGACMTAGTGCLQIKFNDTTPPTASVTTSKVYTRSPSTLYFTYTLTFNAVNASGNVVSNYAFTIPAADPGSTTVSYWAVDNAGNIQLHQSQAVTTNP